MLSDTSEQLTNFIQNEHQTSIIRPFSDQEITINQGRYAVWKCQHVQVIQTDKNFIYLKNNLSEKFSGDINQQIQNMVDQSMNAQSKDIQGFISTIAAQQQQLTKEKIADVFKNIIKTTVTNKITNIIQEGTLGKQKETLNLNGLIEGDTCKFDQTIVTKIYNVNLMQEVLSAILKNHEATTITQKFYEYMLTNSSLFSFGSVGSVVAIIVFIVLLLIVIGVIWHFVAKYRASQAGLTPLESGPDEGDLEDLEE